jgi:hypothetical protein
VEAAASTVIQVEVEAAEAFTGTQVEEAVAEVATKSHALISNLPQAARKVISATCFTQKGNLEAMEEDMVDMEEDMVAIALAGELLEDKTSS